MRKTRDTSAVWCTIWVLLLTGASRVPEGSCAEPAATLKAHGLHYELQEIKEPRVNRIHVLRVDLQAGKIKPVVVVGADRIAATDGDHLVGGGQKSAAQQRDVAKVVTRADGDKASPGEAHKQLRPISTQKVFFRELWA